MSYRARARTLAVGVGLVLVLVTGAVSPIVRAQDAPVTIVQSIEAVTIDPYHTNTLPEFNILRALFDMLIARDDSGKLVPSFLTEWRSVNPTTWELKVRPGVRAHDGSVVDANDLVYNFERGRDPRVAARGSVPYVLGVTKFVRAEAVDNLTLRVVTREPVPFLPAMIAQWSVIPRGFYQRTSLEEASRRAVGTGPYRFVEWRKGERLVVEANEQYWGGAPAIKRIVYRAVPEVAARIAELNAGNADIVLNLTPDLMRQVDPRRGTVATVQGNRRIYIGFVFYGHPAVRDRRVRKALNYGVDFQRIINSLLGGRGRRAGTLVNPPWQSPNARPYPYDPARAQTLLAEAGYRDRDNDGFLDEPSGRRLKLRMVTPYDRYIYDVELSQAVASDWKRIGVDVEVVRLDWSVLAPTLGAGRIPGDMFFLGAGTVFHCLGDLSDWYTGSNWDPGRWANPTFNAMVDELSKTFDEARSQQLCYRAQDYMHQEAPVVFLYFQVDYYGVSNRVDWKPRADERVFPWTIKWK